MVWGIIMEKDNSEYTKNDFIRIGKKMGGAVRRKYIQKKRDNELVASITKRVHRAEGHLEGVLTMISHDAYSADILMQLSAARSYIRQIERLLIKEHIEENIVSQLMHGNKDVMDEMDLMFKTLNR